MKKLFSEIQFLIGLSAMIGGLGLIFTNGLGMPVEWLAGSVFDSYVIPGIILVAVIGGSYFASAVTLFKNHPLAHELSAVAGFGMLIWVFVQSMVIDQTSWLQVLYFGLGVLTLVMTMVSLKGVKKY